MNSDQIFDYSNDFLEEIKDDLINLKQKKLQTLKTQILTIKLKH